MANLIRTGDAFILDNVTINGPASTGTILTRDNMFLTNIQALSDPSTVAGQPYSGFVNTETGTYAQGYFGDGINLDLGEAVRMDTNKDETITDEGYLRVEDFDRYNISVTLADGSIHTGVGVVITGTNPVTGESYQSLVMGDLLVADINSAESNIMKVELGSYQTVTAEGGDLTKTFQLNNFLNNIFDEDVIVVTCFTHGTMILVDSGERPIESLVAGDMVVTKDHGVQEIRWIGSTKRNWPKSAAPIVIKSGTLGNHSDLRVSPQHRMFIENDKAMAWFGCSEFLVNAGHLINGDTVYQSNDTEVEYFHILFDHHEIVFANGAASESFHPGKQVMNAFEEATRAEIIKIFPELSNDLSSYSDSDYTTLLAYEAKIVARTI